MMDIKWASSSDHYYNTIPEFYKYPLLYPVFCLTNTLLINALSDFLLTCIYPPSLFANLWDAVYFCLCLNSYDITIEN